MLCQIGGKAPTAANMKAIATAAGVELDADAAKALIAGMEGKDLAEVLEAGKEKMKELGGGGGSSTSFLDA